MALPKYGSRPLYQQTGKVSTIPAPIGGWNARDPIPELPPEDAVVLDNFIPGTGGVTLRNGYASFATGMTSPVESLMEYSSTDGTGKLFAAAGTSIWNITAGGAVGAANLTSLTNARWQQTMFATSGGNYLIIANGADSVRNYDGSSWTTPSITNVTSSTLISPFAHVKRLFFIKKNSLSAWYLPVESISGAASELNFGSQCRLGGYLIDAASWTRDGGSGSEDYAVFLTSEGEAIIYSGSDPSSASTWNQVGVFKIPNPIGRRCLVKTGADLGVITSQGLLPLSEILPLASSAAGKSAATNKIQGAFASAYMSSGSNFGWQTIEYPKGGLLIVNIPVLENSSQVQFVMNSLTGAWCRFTDINSNCFSLLGDDLYFGGNAGTVYLVNDEYLDDGDPISGDILTSFQNYGTSGFKKFTMARPLFYAPSAYVPAVELKVDFDTSASTLSAPTLSSGGAPWDTSDWDTSDWAASNIPSAVWQGISGIGQVGALRITVEVDAGITLNQCDIMYETGGPF